MNGYEYEKRGMSEDNFGAKGNIVSAFDAFRMQLPGPLTALRGHGTRLTDFLQPSRNLNM